MATNTAVSSGSSKKFLLLGVGSVVVASAVFFAYQRFGNPVSDPTNPVVAQENLAVTSAALLGQTLPPEAQAIVTELQILQKIRPLDTRFFEEPRFRALRETSSEIPTVQPSQDRAFRLEPPQ